MRELGNATGIDAGALVDFQPGMTGAREKLQWASKRVTTRQEDIAYSLFGIFGVQLPIFYGEKKQKALGRLLQEIVAQSGDITALNWVGKSSEFNSCLPADIFSYQAPPYVPPSLSEDNIRRLVSSLRNAVAVESASNLYSLFKNMNPPRFASRRLQLPCMVFRVTEVRRTPGQVQGACFTYEVEADGLLDLVVTTENELIEFSRARPIRQTFVLVRPWDRCLLELPEPFGLDSESHSREFRLMVHLRQPFGALLLAEQRRGEYKRIASDYDIIAQVRDMASIDDMMDVRRLEIL
ncbi:uncharacterized protein EDB91DRAFT_1173217 [Suillus paluster]|uniref:uncharacterized protein n=1 Tax=Suillus paluster TaxID=48578 RepID=UPI001B86F8D3|nr:uncharacterized protein EDB91DRAFT_1173217 [Suillus paluster]KAG1723258.1 hypothetical protein EDB91DRAFT_1173217 [Suillus paluster]